MIRSTMARMDWEKERERLVQVYAAMEDGELEKIASEARKLTKAAWDALREEMLRRGLEAPPEETDPTREGERVKDNEEPKLAIAQRYREETDPAREIENLSKSDENLKLVIVQRYRDMPQALIAKSILDSAGLQSFLSDDNVLRMDWMISNAVGGAKLLVREEDAESARALLKQNTPERFDVEGVGEYEQPKCPQCGSLDISFEELDRKIAYPGLLLHLPIPATLRGWKCHSCAHVWDTDAESQDHEESGEG